MELGRSSGCNTHSTRHLYQTGATRVFTTPLCEMDCVFFKVASTPAERRRALEELEEMRRHAWRIRDVYDAKQEAEFRATRETK